jgi:tRNA threonylcarbamoyladenosine biosynthesis protein TsaE
MNAAPTLSLDALRRGVITHSPEETAGVAAALATLLPADTALALHGDLGAGKTAFAQGFARALGIIAVVNSPTFAIFSVYECPPAKCTTGTRQLVHMDAYRLNAPEDADGLLLWDILRSPWTLLVEWPEKLGDRLPESAWHLRLETLSENSRRLTLF